MPGRPKANIDWNKVDKYLQAQCDGVGIAGLLGVCPDTLYRICLEVKKMTFTAYSAIKKSEGKELLRAKQFSSAMDGNVTMSIWLGKQYLNQRDQSTIDHTNNGTSFNKLSDSELIAIATKLVDSRPEK